MVNNKQMGDHSVMMKAPVLNLETRTIKFTHLANFYDKLNFDRKIFRVLIVGPFEVKLKKEVCKHQALSRGHSMVFS